MVDASAWGEAHALFAVSCLELLCLFYGYRLRKVTWEQLWILIVECFSYGCAATVPEAQFRTLQLSNGREIPWLRFMGWLLTCPVLLMGLVSIGTMTGTSTSVRLVPILVANMVMILLGITSAAIDEPGVQRIVFGLAVAAGGIVFMSAAQVFHSLYTFLCEQEKSTSVEVAAVARRLCVGLAASFFGGWVLFPVGFTLGPNLTKCISDRQEHVFFFVGDFLSKNVYVVVMIFFKHWFLRTLDARATSDSFRSSNNGELPPGVRAERRPSQIIVQEMTDGFPRDARRIDFASGRTATPTPVVPPIPTQLDAVTLRTIIPPENMQSSYGGVSRSDSVEASRSTEPLRRPSKEYNASPAFNRSPEFMATDAYHVTARQVADDRTTSLPEALPRQTFQRRLSREWVAPKVARTQPSDVPPSAGESAQQTPESVAIASAIAAALATLDGVGESHPERLSQALRYIAENPSIALAPSARRQ